MTSSVNKLGASLPDDARVVIYDRHMFIVQATGGAKIHLLLFGAPHSVTNLFKAKYTN